LSHVVDIGEKIALRREHSVVRDVGHASSLGDGAIIAHHLAQVKRFFPTLRPCSKKRGLTKGLDSVRLRRLRIAGKAGSATGE
jgi:hypothetical protein